MTVTEILALTVKNCIVATEHKSDIAKTACIISLSFAFGSE